MVVLIVYLFFAPQSRALQPSFRFLFYGLDSQDADMSNHHPLEFQDNNLFYLLQVRLKVFIRYFS